MISCQDTLSPFLSLFLSYFHVHVHVRVGLISRQEGDIQGSLELFRKAVILNPNSAACVKQVARSVYACINFVLYMWQSHVENEYYALTVEARSWLTPIADRLKLLKPEFELSGRFHTRVTIM